MTEHEIDHLAEQFKPVVDPRPGAVRREGRQGDRLRLALPDLNVVFRHNRSGRLLPVHPQAAVDAQDRPASGAPASCCSASCRSIGARASTRCSTTGSGPGAASSDITWGEAGWILEDNPAMNAGLEKMSFPVYKTYRLYDRPL